MLAHGQVLDRDIFSYTARGNSWLNHSWLAEIILYYLYGLAGLKGLIFFKILILILAYGLLLKAASYTIPERDFGHELIIALLFIMAIVTGAPRFMVRPLMFTFLGVAVSIYLYARSRKEINSLFYIPLVLMCWVNLHAEFMLGLIMLILFWLYHLVLFLVKKNKYFLKVSLILLLSLAALLITPYGWKLLLHPIKLTSSDLFMTRISEWLPPMHPLFREEPAIKFFYWFLGIGLLSFVLNFKKKDAVFFLFFLTFGLMSLSAIRFMPYVTMAGIPIVAENLGHLKGKIGKRFNRLFFAAIIIWSLFLIKERLHYTEFGLGLAEKVCYPLEAGHFLDEAGISGNIFNMCDFGGFLIWFHPERPVFVDGRLDVYGEKIYQDFMDPAAETWQKYNINYVFLSYRHPATRGLLYENKDWPLVYWDDTALIYLRGTEKNKSLIDRYGYNYIHPLTGSYGFLQDADPQTRVRVFKEIHRALGLSPRSIRAHVVLGDIYVELKEYEKAVSAYEDAVRLGEKYNTAYMVKIYQNLARLYHNLRNYPQAERYYRQVITMSRPYDKLYSEALEDWGQLSYQEGDKSQAFKLIKKAVKYKKPCRNSIFSDYPIILAKLALLYEDLGKKDRAILTWEEVYKIGGLDTRQQAEEHIQSLRGLTKGRAEAIP